MRVSPIWSLLLCAVVACTMTLPLWAQGAAPTRQERETARTLVYRGDALAKEQRYGEALKSYLAADAIMHVPTTGIEVARMYGALGQFIEARDKALAVARPPADVGAEPAPFQRARQDAASLASQWSQQVATLRIVVTGVDATVPLTVRVDGARVDASAAIEVNPGEHYISAAAPNVGAAAREVTVRRGASSEVTLTLQRGPDGGSEITTPLMIAGFAAGGLGVVLGAVTGGLALGKTNDIKDGCVDNACPPALTADREEAERLANASNISFAVGGVGLALGLITLLVSLGDSDEPAAETAVVVEPTADGLRLRF